VRGFAFPIFCPPPRAFIGYHVRSKNAYSQDNSLAVHGEKEGDYSIGIVAFADKKIAPA
jgi:hypothetical protein